MNVWDDQSTEELSAFLLTTNMVSMRTHDPQVLACTQV
jgi:hypothetical protein